MPVSSHVHPIVYRQQRYNLIRRFIRDILLRQIAFRLLVKVHVEGEERIPDSGPTLLIMNHIAAIDPFVVVGIVRRRFPVPMSKIENYYNPVVGLMARSWGAYPVRRGEVDRQALASTIELLKQGHAVLIAPEGTRHPALRDAKDGMAYVAVKTGAVVVPIGLEVTDQFPGSLKRLRRAPVTVNIGRPFRFKGSSSKRIPRDELHLMTREAMWQIARLLPEHRRGEYGDLERMTTDTLEFVD